MNEYVLQTIVSGSTIVFEMFIAYMYVAGLTQEKCKRRIPAALMYPVFGLLLFSLSFTPNPLILNLIATFLGITALMRLTDNGKLRSHIVRAVWFAVIVVLSESFVAGIIMLINRTNIESAYNDQQFHLIGVIVTKLVQILIVKVAVFIFKHQIFRAVAIKQILILTTCQISSIGIVLIAMKQQFSEEKIPLDFILQIVAILFINVVIFLYYDRTLHLAELRYQNDAMQRQIDSQRKYYNLVQKQQKATEAFNHDIQKHINVVQGLFRNDNEQMIHEYLNQLKHSQQNIVVATPHPTVSVILYDCLLWTLEKNIKANYDISIFEDIGITDLEVTTVLGNTIENAKRALTNVGNEAERTLNVILRQKGHFLYYEISNTFDPTCDNSSSNDRHYGLANVKCCAEKYGGKFDVIQTDDLYTVSILFMASADAPT